MDINSKKYSQFALCKEMFETIDIVKNFDPGVTQKYVGPIQKKQKLLLTGEGSSRLFPAKHMIYQNLIKSCGTELFTEGATQALDYNLNGVAVFGASNSGKTKELLRLMNQQKKVENDALFGMVSNRNTPLEEIAHRSTVLTCGPENAVAATKSVVEQALFYHSLYFNLLNETMKGLEELAHQIKEVLETPVEASIVQKLVNAPVIYFSGRNNGVAEEITLKTNEIAHKRSGYNEGTYAVHGIEEAMGKDDVVVVFEPFEAEEEKFKEVLVDGVGIEVIAISSRNTLFPTLRIPQGGAYSNYLELVMGWNLLVETGLQLGINLDKPERARKVGNELNAPV